MATVATPEAATDNQAEAHKPMMLALSLFAETGDRRFLHEMERSTSVFVDRLRSRVSKMISLFSRSCSRHGINPGILRIPTGSARSVR